MELQFSDKIVIFSYINEENSKILQTIIDHH